MYVTKKEYKVECHQFNRENVSTTNQKKKIPENTKNVGKYIYIMPVSSYFARDLVILMESRRFSLHHGDGNLAWIKSTYTLSVDQHWALGQIYCPYPIKTGGIV